MRYIEESLTTKEKLVLATRPHWVVLVPSICVLIAAMLIWNLIPRYFFSSQPMWHGLYFNDIAAILVALVGFYSLVKSYIFYTTSEYGITTTRVIMKMGWIQRNSIEIFLNRLEAVNVRQTLMGRIFNYGTVIIVGTGGTSDFYPNVPGPVHFRKVVQQEMAKVVDPS